MPLYEYECEACGLRFELIRRFSDPPLEACATCGKGPVRKLVSSPAFQFKGSGWYITDYARKSGGGDSKSGEGGPSTPVKSDSAPAAGQESSAEKAAPASAPTSSAASAKDSPGD
jgi:putative FmdB family regulatory protein